MDYNDILGNNRDEHVQNTRMRTLHEVIKDTIIRVDKEYFKQAPWCRTLNSNKNNHQADEK